MPGPSAAACSYMRLLVIEVFFDVMQDVVADLILAPDTYQFLTLGTYRSLP